MNTFDAYQAKLKQFADQIPRLLARHPETLEEAELILAHIAKLEQARCFRLAVTGKIKQGKSTLINALIGRSLPTVGVNETTATLNFINYGTGADLQKISVCWKDGRADDEYPLDFLTRFQGEGAKPLAEQIKGISLFAEAAFLRNVQLIDTPGELGTLLNEIDIKADALIRVLPYVAEANDLNHLDKFGCETRPFGSGAYNSIAVIQKWEYCWPDYKAHDPFSIDPFENALRRAEEQCNVLGDAVSCVLPVSGLLELFSKDVDNAWLNKFLEFANQASKDDLMTMLEHQHNFTDDDDYKTAPLELRQQVWRDLKTALKYNSKAAWPTLKMAVWAVQRYSPTHADTLRERLHTMSNIDSLNEILRKRFFALSDLIHTGSQLNKALIPCNNAVHRLSVKREKHKHLLEEGVESLQTLDRMTTVNLEAKQDIRLYIQKMQRIVEKEIGWLGDTCRQIATLDADIKSSFNTIEKEIAFLHLLDGKGTETCFSEARRILGQWGIEINQRLGCEPECSPQAMSDKAWEFYDRWRQESYSLPQGVQEAVINRLNLILNVLDENVK